MLNSNMKQKKKSTSNIKMSTMNSKTVSALLEEYSRLLSGVDDWFMNCQQIYPSQIACAKGCSECCSGLFDITILDAALLNRGFERLPGETQRRISAEAINRLKQIRSIWPEFSHPFTLNHRSEEEIEELMATDNDSKCILLDDQGRCLLYDCRPMTCRLHGLPLVDVSGEVMESEWCTKNFIDGDPLKLTSLCGPFEELFRNEATLVRYFTKELLGKTVNEMDTFIPTSLLIEFRKFDWQGWFVKYPVKT